MTARDDVLARISSALGRPPATAPGGQPAGPGDEVPRAYRTGGSLGSAALLGLLAERLADYGCSTRRATPGDLAASAAAALTARGARRVIVPPGLSLTGPPDPGGPDDPTAGPPGTAGVPGSPPSFPGLPPGTEVLADDGHSAAALDSFDAVVTGAAVAIAETGTIVLDGSPGQGRRALTLIPDYHLCILHARQVVALVPEALERLRPDRPLTWISGPSATSDIELDRVEGVHGPRTLEVILVEDSPQAGG